MTCNIAAFVFAVATSLTGMRVQAEEGGLIVADKEIKLSVPVPLQSSFPLQLDSSLSTQYSVDSSVGMLRLGNLILDQGLRYPPLFGDLYSGNSISANLMPSVNAGLPKTSVNSAYLTSWLNKQWASVNLSIAHTHLIEKSEEQLTYGIYKSVSVLNNSLFFSVGESLFNDLSNRYWYRTTNVSLDYAWKRWNLSMFVEQRSDASMREQSVWTSIKKRF
ncbi:MAG: hypothetical protein WCS70_07895 [Verrucomicrobiota bacterium]